MSAAAAHAATAVFDPRALTPEEEAVRSMVMQSVTSATTLQHVFKVLDMNGDGFIDGEEFGELVASVKMMVPAAEGVDAASLFGKLDLDDDNEISFAEFKAFAAGRAGKRGDLPAGWVTARSTHVEDEVVFENAYTARIVHTTPAQRNASGCLLIGDRSHRLVR